MHYKHFKKRKIMVDSSKIRYFVAAAAAAVISTVSRAQDMGGQLLSAANGSLKGLVQNLVELLQTVMGLGALVTLAIVIFKVFKGDREAAEKLAWWVGGLAVGFVLLSVVAGLIQ